MDYKKFFPSRALRFRILRALSFVPDSVMLRLQYRIKMGFWADFNHPKRYTEKLQLYKMYYRNADMPRCADKYEVRGYLEERGFGHLLNTLYGVYDRAEDIDFATLPERFVIKTTDGGGGLNVLICKDKSNIDIPAAVAEINSWLNVTKVRAGREWAYTGIKKSRIIVEEFLENDLHPEAGLEDYKFFCFDGKPYCVVNDCDRYIEHKRNFYDLNWQNLGISSDCPTFEGSGEKPAGLEQMIEVAAELSKGFPFVRVDLYYANSKVYFGELTFYPWSGYVKFRPEEFDYKLGELFDISSFHKNA